MGVDLLDIGFRIEREFDISWASDEWRHWETLEHGPIRDPTVGELFERILGKLRARGVSSPLNPDVEWEREEVWKELTAILVDCLAVESSEVTPEARLFEDLGAA